MAGGADDDVEGGDRFDPDGLVDRELAPHPGRADRSAPEGPAEGPGDEQSQQSQQ